MELLNLTQSKILNNGFLKCFASLHDPANAFVGQKTNPVQMKSKRTLTRMETLNSIYGRTPTQYGTNNAEFSQITETSNEDTDPEIKRTEAYLN